MVSNDQSIVKCSGLLQSKHRNTAQNLQQNKLGQLHHPTSSKTSVSARLWLGGLQPVWSVSICQNIQERVHEQIQKHYLCLYAHDCVETGHPPCPIRNPQPSVWVRLLIKLIFVWLWQLQNNEHCSYSIAIMASSFFGSTWPHWL